MRNWPRTCVEYKSAHAPPASYSAHSAHRCSYYFATPPFPSTEWSRPRVLCTLRSILVRSVLPILSARTHLPQVLSCIVRVEKKFYKFFLSHSLPGQFFSYRSLDLRPPLPESNRKDIFYCLLLLNSVSPSITRGRL